MTGPRRTPSGDAERDAELRDFARRARATLRSAPVMTRVRERALVERTLAATTREDLGVRGDWRLVREFAGARWRSSPAVRVAAASLLLHLAALPVLGYYALRRSAPPQPTIGFELPAEQAFDEPLEPAPLPVPADDARFLDPDAATLRPDADRVEAELRRTRFALHRRRAPEVRRSSATATAVSRLLAARSAGILDGDWTALPAPTELAHEPRAVEPALWVEAMLDRLALEGVLLPGARAGLERLEVAETGSDRAIGALHRAAARRAWRAGVAPSDLVERWRRDGWRPVADGEQAAHERPLGPLDPGWLELLVRALGARYRGDDVVGAWLDWSPTR